MDADVVVVVVVEGGAMVGVVAVVVGASMASVGVLSPLPQAAPMRARAEMRSALRFMGQPLPTCIRYTQQRGNRFTEEMPGVLWSGRIRVRTWAFVMPPSPAEWLPSNHLAGFSVRVATGCHRSSWVVMWPRCDRGRLEDASATCVTDRVAISRGS